LEDEAWTKPGESATLLFRSSRIKVGARILSFLPLTQSRTLQICCSIAAASWPTNGRSVGGHDDGVCESAMIHQVSHNCVSRGSCPDISVPCCYFCAPTPSFSTLYLYSTLLPLVRPLSRHHSLSIHLQRSTTPISPTLLASSVDTHWTALSRHRTPPIRVVRRRRTHECGSHILTAISTPPLLVLNPRNVLHLHHALNAHQQPAPPRCLLRLTSPRNLRRRHLFLRRIATSSPYPRPRVESSRTQTFRFRRAPET
jgi:hypothetical protein